MQSEEFRQLRRVKTFLSVFCENIRERDLRLDDNFAFFLAFFVPSRMSNSWDLFRTQRKWWIGVSYRLQEAEFEMSWHLAGTIRTPEVPSCRERRISAAHPREQ